MAVSLLKKFFLSFFILACVVGGAYGVYHFMTEDEPTEEVISIDSIGQTRITKQIIPIVPKVSIPKRVLPPVPGEPFENYLFIGFDMAQGLHKWQEKKYEKRTTYRIIQDKDGTPILDALSLGTSSVIAKSVNLDPDKEFHLSWAWRVTEFPDRPNISFNGKKDNDYAIRVYVLYKGITFLTPEVIQYVWDETYPVGTHGTSPYTKRVKTLVIKSGVPETDDWAHERRDIIGDYEMLFGKKLNRDIQAIAIMSDSDNTDTRSAAQVKDIWLQLPKT